MKYESNWFTRLGARLREWRKETRAKHELANQAVDNRQINRRRLFEDELHTVNMNYGGEPRKARRGIARTLATKRWRGWIKEHAVLQGD